MCAAFLTWSRGQNEYGAGIAGPLPRSFMRAQFDLQKRILKRSRALGLTAQLPGFQGNVPVALKGQLKDSNITTQVGTAPSAQSPYPRSYPRSYPEPSAVPLIRTGGDWVDGFAGPELW